MLIKLVNRFLIKFILGFIGIFARLSVEKYVPIHKIFLLLLIANLCAINIYN